MGGLDRDGLKAVGIGAGIALLMLAVPPLRFVGATLTSLIHEMGHALAAIAFGRPALPAFDFTYGGGVTVWGERNALLQAAMIAAVGYGVWRARGRLRIAAGAGAALYLALAFTSGSEALVIFMGHGTELVIGGVFLYRGFSGAAVIHSAERPLYAALGMFIPLNQGWFALKLVASAEARAEYAEAKGGGRWMDFDRLALDYFDCDLRVVAAFFVLCAAATPIVAYVAFRLCGSRAA